MKASNRNSSIELLRILAMCGVILLHYNNSEIGGGLRFTQGGNYLALMVIESIFIGAVNLYILISGYFLSGSSKRRIIKPLELVIQVCIFGLAKYILRWLMVGQWSASGLINYLVPNNYFVTLYVVVYLLSPYLNLVFERLSQRKFTTLVLLMLVLFSIWLTALELMDDISGTYFSGMSTVNAFESQRGYTIVNFVLMYTLGAYIRRNEERLTRLPWYGYLCAFAFNVVVLAVWSVHFSKSVWAYCNPLVIMNACYIFLAFKQFRFNSRMINSLAKGAFTCFLLHDIFIGRIGIAYAAKASLPVLLGHVVVSAAGIYLVCYVGYVVWNFVTKWMFTWVGKRLSDYDRLFSLYEEEKIS